MTPHQQETSGGTKKYYPASIPEGRIKTDYLRYLARRDFFIWNNPSGTVRIAPDRWVHFGRKGSSDIIGVLPDGRFLAVERS